LACVFVIHLLFPGHDLVGDWVLHAIPNLFRHDDGKPAIKVTDLWDRRQTTLQSYVFENVTQILFLGTSTSTDPVQFHTFTFLFELLPNAILSRESTDCFIYSHVFRL
jgi:hypothetical protein